LSIPPIVSFGMTRRRFISQFTLVCVAVGVLHGCRLPVHSCRACCLHIPHGLRCQGIQLPLSSLATVFILVSGAVVLALRSNDPGSPAWPSVPFSRWRSLCIVAVVYLCFWIVGELLGQLLHLQSWLVRTFWGQLLIYTLASMPLAHELCVLPRPELLGKWFRVHVDAHALRMAAAGVALSLAVARVVIPFNNWLLLEGNSVHKPQTLAPELAAIASLAAQRQIGPLVLFASLVAVVGPLWEEFFFRGFLVTAFSRGDSKRAGAAVVLSSLIFGFFHCQPGASRDQWQPLLPTAALGWVFGVLFLRSRNLVPAILCHQAWNGGYVVLVALLAWQGSSVEDLAHASQWYA